MTIKPLPIDLLATKIGNDVVDYLRNWMRGASADDVDFHRYRMRLLSSLSDANSTTEKLTLLIEKINPRMKFDVLDAISDKIMGESLAKYIFARIMIIINEEYRKLLENEADKVKSENNSLIQRTSDLKVKIEHH